MKRFYYIDNEGHKVAIQNYLVNSEAITRVELKLETKASQTDLRTHTLDQSNPHGVTKAQVGLENVNNTSDLDKPISTATQGALDLKENVSNKVTSISDASTNTEYPSAKAVYDSLDSFTQGKESTSNKVTSLSYFSTDTQYPSAKAVYDELISLDSSISGKENTFNKVTSLSSSSTDLEYPSAKAVYDELDDINTTLTSTNTTLAGKEESRNKTVTLSSLSTDTQYPSAKVVYDTVAGTERTIALAEQLINNTLTTHIDNVYNPHNVTKSQIGLGNVDNTSDLNKPISNATKTYIDSKLSILDSVLSNILDEYIDVKDIILFENGEEKTNIIKTTYNVESSGSISVVGDSGIYNSNTKLYIDKVKDTTTPTTHTFTAGTHDCYFINTWTVLISDSFKNCTALTSIYIPETVTAIGNTTFEGCTGLTDVTIKGLSTTLNLSWSDDISDDCVRDIMSTWTTGASIEFSPTATTRLTSELDLTDFDAYWSGNYLRYGDGTPTSQPII